MDLGAEFETEEQCKTAQRVMSKWGYTICCSEEDVPNAIVVAEGCESAQEVARKFGYTVLCADE